MKKYRFLFLLLILVFILPINAKAFRGSYRYDINKVIYNGTNLEIYGWAVINSGSTAIHNIETEYTLDVFGVNSSGNLVSSTSISLINANKADAYRFSGYYTQPSYSGTYDRPRDYTKAFFVTSDTYPEYPTGNGIDRAIAIERTGNKFYINTDFCFIVPISEVKKILKTPTVKTVRFDLNVKVPSRTLTVYGKTFKTTSASKTIHLAIPENRVISYASTLGSSGTNLEFTDTPKGITNIASDARAQANPVAFIGSSSVKYVKAYNPYTKSYLILQEKYAIQYGYTYQYLYYAVDGTYTKVGESFLTDIGTAPSGAKYGYFYYNVNISLGSGNVAQNGGAINAYIPALWGTPTAGSVTGMEIKTRTCENYCIENSSDGKCPSSTTTAPTKDKCCDEICSKATYKDSSFCVTHCKQPVVVKTCDDLCKSLKKGSTCPTTNKTTPSKDKCCKELCYDTKANSDSYYCKSICTYTCEDHYCNKKSPLYDAKICKSTKCNPPATATCKDFCDSNSDDGKCPASTTKSPTKSKCCTEICTKTNKYAGTEFCTNYCKVDECDGIKDPTEKYCCKNPDDKATCNPDKTCGDDITDPQEKYCKCVNSSDPICRIYERKDSSYSKATSCSEAEETSYYKYPKAGYGDEQYNNEACKISCSETIRVTFPKAISEVRAGMGFTYPIKIDSDRYCTAEYLNDSWKQAVEDAITNAKNAYNTMKTSIDKAYSDDAVCGDKLVVDAGNTCSGGESLTSEGKCKKNIGFGTCSGSSTSTETYKSSTSCKANGATCDCSTTTSSRSCKKYSKKTGACTSYGPWNSGGSSTSSYSICSGSYESGSCYSYRGACPDRSSWNSSTGRCEKIMCSNNSSTYFSDAQSNISPSISSANSAKSTYQSALARYNKLVNDRNTCDNYTTQIKYAGAANANITIDSAADIKQTNYELTSSTSTEPGTVSTTAPKNYQVTTCISKENYVAKDSKYNDGVYPGGGENLSVEKCNFDVRNYAFYDYWNKKSSATNEYEFKTSYSVMEYTGEILETSTVPKDTGAYVPHGRYAYIGFYDLTGNYEFTNRLTNIGANISNKDKSIFELDFNCSYNVNNVIFPQKDDDNFKIYGSVGFSYRPISLLDVFPNRGPRENWSTSSTVNVANIIKGIEDNGYSIYSNTPKYVITLTSDILGKIREYNSGHGYDDINVKTPYTSNFITEYLNNGAINTSEKRGS